MSVAIAQLTEQGTRHQVYIERLKSGEVNQFASFLQQIDRSVRVRLSGEDVTAFSRARMERLLTSIEKDLTAIYAGHWNQLSGNLYELAEYEAGFESRSLNKISQGSFETVVPSSNQVRSAVLSAPLSVRGADGGKLLESFIKDWSATEVKRVSGAIRQGYYEGQTTNQILQAVRGTRANGFRDGILAISNRNASTVVRTAVQHVSSVAREETWRENSDIVEGVTWVSTLDAKTSAQCASLDGQVFPVDSGPRPPIHMNCLAGDTDVLSRSGIANVYKRHYEGRIVKIRTEAGRTLTITPNHPILARGGWKAAGEVDCFDELAAIPDPALIKGNKKDCVKAKFSNLFAAAYVSVDSSRITKRPAAPENFHGDGANSDVCVVNVDSFGRDGIRERLGDNPKHSGVINGLTVRRALFGFGALDLLGAGMLATAHSLVCFASKAGYFLGSAAGHPSKLLLRPVARTVTPVGKVFFYCARAGAKLFSYSSDANPALKHGYDSACVYVGEGALVPAEYFNPVSFRRTIDGMDSDSSLVGRASGGFARRNKIKGLADSIFSFFSSLIGETNAPEPLVEKGFCKAGDGSALLDGGAGSVQFDRVIECRVIDFCGHVYNLENEENWYLSNGIVTHNCRSAVVARLSNKFRFLDDGGTRSSRGPEGVGSVDAKETYYSWLKKQPKEFQIDALGPTRAKLLRDGGLSAERFAELNLGRNFAPLSLADMKRIEPNAFLRAGID